MGEPSRGSCLWMISRDARVYHEWHLRRRSVRYGGACAPGGSRCGRNAPPGRSASCAWCVRRAARRRGSWRPARTLWPARSRRPRSGRRSTSWPLGPERITAWRRALTEPAPPPLAVLRIPKIRLEAAVLQGTEDVTLNRAVGHIDATALPETDGNSGIAGHRDGFFRGLKDIGPEDVIELETLRGKEVYRVERTWMVAPEDVSVLDPTPDAVTHAGDLLPVLPRRPSAR